MWLLYRRGGLGDTLLTFPVLELIKRSGVGVWAVGNVDYFSLAKAVGWADEISSELPPREFENRVVISFEGNVKPFPQERIWIVEHYLRSLKLKGKFSKTLPIEPEEKSPLSGRVVLHPSSGSQKKNPPLELFLMIESFLRKEGFKTIYLVGEADGWLKAHVKEYFESFSPLEMARALKTAKLFLGLDSGLSHLASYCGISTFIFYGPTDPLVWKPIGERVFQISLELPCSPCFPQVCQERECLRVDRLFDAFLRVYNR
ncbi:MAG: glycosyltransferase family 9 protein [Aquificaceae bacterium]|nr:glycosyltransferase family 9 protein [Aquificaceae bacterium]MDW8294851.1 glycosyltransferase family 9 protein [Aquificaceae bacterium]